MKSTLWGRLTRYRTWAITDDEVLDGTNNATERAIGWWVKERYRTMRGCQRPQSVCNASRHIACAGNSLDGPGAELALDIPKQVGTGGGLCPCRQLTRV